LGKYYFVPLNKEETLEYCKLNVEVIEEQTSTQELLDFMAKLKTVSTGRDQNYSTSYAYYFYNLNENESAILASGHHCHHDGSTIL
jgi:hypothetical protein